MRKSWFDLILVEDSSIQSAFARWSWPFWCLRSPQYNTSRYPRVKLSALCSDTRQKCEHPSYVHSETGPFGACGISGTILMHLSKAVCSIVDPSCSPVSATVLLSQMHSILCLTSRRSVMAFLLIPKSKHKRKTIQRGVIPISEFWG